MNRSDTTTVHNTSIHRATRWLPLLSLLMVVMLVAACGGGGGESDDGTSDSASDAAETRDEGHDSDGGIPTMPAAQFAAPTTMIDPTKVAETENEATPEPEAEPDLTFGEEAYDELCAECHGAAGEGVADKGDAIVGLATDYSAFDDLLRSGGGYGNDHIFGPSAISDDGIESLFAYVQTMEGE